MKKGLLLGNGINNRIGIKELSAEEIGERFQRNVKVYRKIVESLFDVDIKQDFFADLGNSSPKLGIETLAGKLYTYIKKMKGNEWAGNDEYRIQELLTCICLTSIFFTVDGKVNGDYDPIKLPLLQNYDVLFSLNYYEFWNKNKECVYLHEHYDLEDSPDQGRVLLVSDNQMNLPKYAQIVEEMKQANRVEIIDANKTIFAPEQLEKSHLLSVEGTYPSEKSYPAEDALPFPPRKLYTELLEVDELDIFGVSPYGDESIIAIINSIDKVRVFVYQRDSSPETEEWKKRLTGRYELLDSMEMG